MITGTEPPTNGGLLARSTVTAVDPISPGSSVVLATVA